MPAGEAKEKNMVKSRMIVLAQMFYEYTDQEHPMTGQEILDYLKREQLSAEYYSFFLSDGFLEMSLLGRCDYEVPYYNINGDIDYQTNYSLASEYFEQVNAPKKQMFVMKDATHGLLESRSEEFSGYLHQIADL